ncbi:MAG TPA: hypothetical protein PLO67_03290, partial [Saprospiraceae bacterium]|nr:hypothetical protein [Saprospiraceae bacterium]
MKQKNKSLFWVFLAFGTLGLYAPAQAQDDLYYDPATDAHAPATSTTNSDDSEYREPSNITRRYDEDGYSDEDDDYAYQYSSRIRRFHRPSPVVDYYDPFYVDLYYYDPYFLPGNSIYTYGYNDYWTWRQWRRAQRWNSYYSWGVGPVWSSWGWSSCYNSFGSPWSNPWAFNNYYYDPYWTYNGYNPYYGYGNGYGNNWSNNDYYYSNVGNNNGNNFQPKTYTGVRRSGSTVNPGYARIADNNGGLGRLVDQKQTGPVLENRSAPRTPAVKNVEPGRPAGKPALENTRTPESTSTRRPDGTTTRPGTTDQPERTTPGRETTPRRSESPAETRPTRREQTETRPSRTESPTPTRRNEPESRPSRTEER